MTAPTHAIQVEAARARWRADLLDYDAAEHVRIAGDDQSPTAQGIVDTATTKTAEATIHLDHAEAIERHSIAKQEKNANPKDEAAYAEYQAATAALIELRSYWRGIGEAVGNRRFVQDLDHFPEPAEEDLVLGGGS